MFCARDNQYRSAFVLVVWRLLGRLVRYSHSVVLLQLLKQLWCRASRSAVLEVENCGHEHITTAVFLTFISVSTHILQRNPPFSPCDAPGSLVAL
jgi:hypothetical protein